MGAARPSEPADSNWVTINEAAALVGRSRRTIYHWITKGLLVTRREAGGAQHILVSSLFKDDAAPPVPIPPDGGVMHIVDGVARVARPDQDADPDDEFIDTE